MQLITIDMDDMIDYIYDRLDIPITKSSIEAILQLEEAYMDRLGLIEK